MAGAVEAVAADAVFFVIFIRKSIHIRFLGNGLVESGVEYSNLRNAFHNLFADLNAHKVCRVVERAERNALPDSVLDLFINKNAAAELFAAVEDSVANRRNFVHRLKHTVFLSGEGLNEFVDSVGMSCAGLKSKLINDLDELAVPVGELVGKSRERSGKLLKNTVGKNLFLRHKENGIFERGAARVDNQFFNAHFL